MKGVFFWERLREIQTHSIDRSLSEAAMCFRMAGVVKRIHGEGYDGKRLTESWKLLGFAHLNRACELASIPLTQHYAQSSNSDLDLMWVTYRPEAVPRYSTRSITDAMIYLGSVDKLTEDQARARAIGY